MPPTLASLTIADDPAAWQRAGFAVTGAVCQVGPITLQLTGAEEPRGIRSWALRGAPEGLVDIDGLATHAAEDVADGGATSHANGATGVDHVVVGSPNRDRTIAAIWEALGLEPRRQTGHQLYGRPMVQTFYVLGDAVLEVISRPDETGDDPAVFWGLAFTVADLDATAAALGEPLGEPRDAVQPGRRIATLRGDAVGVSVPVAFLTPRL